MPDAVMPSEASTAPLGQVERVVDTFVAPSKTFFDIRRSASWWLPWIIGVLVSLAFGFAVQQKIGWVKVSENMIHQSPAQQQRIDSITDPQAKAHAIDMSAKITSYIFWATPFLSLLVTLITAAVLLATINFGFGGTAKFGQMFAVWMYGTLPWAIQAILGIITVYVGVDPDSFNLKNFVGTNIGYYLPQDISKPIMALCQSIDIFTIWALVLLTIGCAIVGNVKKSKAATAVFGWWVVIIILKMVGAMFS